MFEIIMIILLHLGIIAVSALVGWTTAGIIIKRYHL